jgi:hypothetical protein
MRIDDQAGDQHEHQAFDVSQARLQTELAGGRYQRKDAFEQQHVTQLAQRKYDHVGERVERERHAQHAPYQTQQHQYRPAAADKVGSQQ